MEEQAADFHRKVREAYLELAAEYPGRYRRIDGSGDAGAVANEVWNAVRPRLRQR